MANIILPTAKDFYGDITTEEFEFCLEENRKVLKGMGLSCVDKIAIGTDCAQELWSDRSGLRLIGHIETLINDPNNGDEFETDEFDIWRVLENFQHS